MEVQSLTIKGKKKADKISASNPVLPKPGVIFGVPLQEGDRAQRKCVQPDFDDGFCQSLIGVDGSSRLPDLCPPLCTLSGWRSDTLSGC